jgi:hypothetical protein
MVMAKLLNDGETWRGTNSDHTDLQRRGARVLWYVSRRFPSTGKEQAKPHRAQALDHVTGSTWLGDHDDDPTPQAAQPQRRPAAAPAE